jgi:hypothetical protein
VRILKESWKDAMEAEVYKPDFELRTNISEAASWLVLQLAERGLPFKVVNLGAGVKLITRKTNTCPKCHGTGKV